MLVIVCDYLKGDLLHTYTTDMKYCVTTNLLTQLTSNDCVRSNKAMTDLGPGVLTWGQCNSGICNRAFVFFTQKMYKYV